MSLVDPSDQQYSAQRALVGGDAAFFITELLADPAAAVRAAEAVAALTQHSAEAQARLAAGAGVSLDSRVERVGLNPCQSGAACWRCWPCCAVIEPPAGEASVTPAGLLPSCPASRLNARPTLPCPPHLSSPSPPLLPLTISVFPPLHLSTQPPPACLPADFTDSGCMSALVPMLFSRQEAAREAATEAVAALCSYHQEGKLAYLEGLVQEVLQRQRGFGGGGQQQGAGAAEVGRRAGG